MAKVKEMRTQQIRETCSGWIKGGHLESKEGKKSANFQTCFFQSSNTCPSDVSISDKYQHFNITKEWEVYANEKNLYAGFQPSTIMLNPFIQVITFSFFKLLFLQ